MALNMLAMLPFEADQIRAIVTASRNSRRPTGIPFRLSIQPFFRCLRTRISDISLSLLSLQPKS